MFFRRNLDLIGNNGVVLDQEIGVAILHGLEHGRRIIIIADFQIIFFLVFLGENRSGGAFLDCGGLAFQILQGMNVGVLDIHDDRGTGFDIAIREVHRFLAFFGNVHPGDGAIDLAGFDSRNDAAEVHRLQFIFESFDFGDGRQQFHVDAAIFAVLFKRKWRVFGIAGDEVNFVGIGLPGRSGGSGGLLVRTAAGEQGHQQHRSQ